MWLNLILDLGITVEVLVKSKILGRSCVVLCLLSIIDMFMIDESDHIFLLKSRRVVC